MTLQEKWRSKTDEQVYEAAKRLDEYTAETQSAILAEVERRSSPARKAEQAAQNTSLNDIKSELRERLRKAEQVSQDERLQAAQHQEPLRRPEPPAARRVEPTHPVPALDAVRRPVATAESYQYKVVPFIGQSKGSLSASDVARQLESAISQHVSEGWEFYQLADVNIEVKPGCISGLFGAQVQYVRFDQLIFRAQR
jgi:hypothetical protein